MLAVFHTEVHVFKRVPLPQQRGCLLVIANHRSFLDGPLVFLGSDNPVRLVSHAYLAHVPVVNQVIQQLGGFHPGGGGRGWSQLFRQAAQYLIRGEHVAIFPEGATLIAQSSTPVQGAPFQRGFAHLALRSALVDLPIVPISIISRKEISTPLLPLPLLRLIDPREPMFQRVGWHPLVIYQQVEVHVGAPRHIRLEEIQGYRKGQALALTTALALEMEQATQQLTRTGMQQSW